jgi:DNA-directed RNA polymerase beta subunit
MAGALLGKLFNQLFRNFTDVMTKIFKRDIDAGNEKILFMKDIMHDIITDGQKAVLTTATGAKIGYGNVVKNGVCYFLNRRTFLSLLLLLRRLNTPLAKTGKFQSKVNCTTHIGE